MKLQIERKYVEAMVDEFPGLSALKDQLRFGNKSEVSFKQLTNAELSFLQVLYKKAGAQGPQGTPGADAGHGKADDVIDAEVVEEKK